MKDKKYNRKEYEKYLKEWKKEKKSDTERPVSFEEWQEYQPIADKAIGEVNEQLKTLNN